MAKDQFRKYLWILDTLYRTGGITLEELNRRWKLSVWNDSGEAIPRRTFINCRRAVEQAFDVNIGCNSADGYKYYIEDTSDIRNGEIRHWVLSAFAISNMIQESRKLRDRILMEEIPSGNSHLVSIVQAMKDGVRLKLVYQAFYHEEPFGVEVEPYCVKAFRQRWYLLARDVAHDRLKTYALDRIRRVESLEEQFTIPATFDARRYFEEYFGVVVQPEESDVETVYVKVWNDRNERQYVRSLPLHSSQKEVECTDDYSVFTYRLRPSVDFYQELLKHGDELEVLSPQWVREDMIAYVREMARRYGFGLTPLP